MQLAERGVRRALTMRADVRVGVALLAFVAAAALLIPSGPLEIDASWSELMLDLRNAGLDAIALALRTRSPILVEEAVIDNAKTVDFSSERADADRLQKWLESLDPEELGKYKM